MIVKVIVNRGVLNITSPDNHKSGTTGVLTAGPQKILFATFGLTNYEDANYDLTFDVYDSNGVPSGFTRGTQEADGFNVTLSYDSKVSFNTNKV